MGEGPHNGEFSIVRHALLDDEEHFTTIYRDKAAFGTWVSLLIAADKTYPAPAPLPRDCDDAEIAKLVKANLVDLLPHDHFWLHGMEKERAKRAERFSAAARARWAKEKDAERRNATQSDAMQE